MFQFVGFARAHLSNTRTSVTFSQKLTITEEINSAERHICLVGTLSFFFYSFVGCGRMRTAHGHFIFLAVRVHLGDESRGTQCTVTPSVSLKLFPLRSTKIAGRGSVPAWVPIPAFPSHLYHKPSGRCYRSSSYKRKTLLLLPTPVEDTDTADLLSLCHEPAKPPQEMF